MKKLSAILCSILIVAVNLNFTVGSHYCGGEKVTTKVMLHRAELGCGMDWVKSECDRETAKSCEHENRHNHYSFNKKDCCQNLYRVFDADIDLTVDHNTSQDTKVQIPFIESAVQKVAAFHIPHFNYIHFNPPPLKRSLSILFQVFRL